MPSAVCVACVARSFFFFFFSVFLLSLSLFHSHRFGSITSAVPLSLSPFPVSKLSFSFILFFFPSFYSPPSPIATSESQLSTCINLFRLVQRPRGVKFKWQFQREGGGGVPRQPSIRQTFFKVYPTGGLQQCSYRPSVVFIGQSL